MSVRSRWLAVTALVIGSCLLTTATAEAGPMMGGGGAFFRPGFLYFPGAGLGYPGLGYGFPGGGYGYPGGGYGYPGGGYSYPSYGGYNYSSTYSTTYSPPLVFISPTYTSRPSAPAMVSTQQASPYNAPQTRIATVEVRVPADATVWFAGTKTDQTGDNRVFESPPLIEGKTYTYEVKAQWMKEGKPVEKTQSLQVRAGQKSVANFAAN